MLIDDGVRATVRERVSTLKCSSTECSHTHYLEEGSRTGCGVTELNRVCGSVSGGGVCYSGDSVGSVAVCFCDDGYTLDGDSTRECLSSNGTTRQCVEKDGTPILLQVEKIISMK